LLKYTQPWRSPKWTSNPELSPYTVTDLLSPNNCWNLGPNLYGTQTLYSDQHANNLKQDWEEIRDKPSYGKSNYDKTKRRNCTKPKGIDQKPRYGKKKGKNRLKRKVHERIWKILVLLVSPKAESRRKGECKIWPNLVSCKLLITSKDRQKISLQNELKTLILGQPWSLE